MDFLREFARLLVAFTISYLLTAGVVDNLVFLLFGARVDTATQLEISGLISFLLKSIDRHLHENAAVGSTAEKGLLRF